AGEARYTGAWSWWESKGVLIRTVPTFDPSGQDAGAVLNSFVCDPSSKSVKPICASLHASSPFAAEALSATPCGSVTVVFLTSASARPPASSVVCWGTFTLTSTPLGVLAECSSGTTSIAGLNGSSEHPSKPNSWPSLFIHAYSAPSGFSGLAHESVCIVKRTGSLCGSAAHAVGSVR